MVYDVIFNPEALEHAKQNSLLQQKLEETAFDAVERNFKVTLDKVNVRRPKLKYSFSTQYFLIYYNASF